MMRNSLCLALLALSANAQQVLNYPQVKGAPGGTIGRIDFYNLAGTFATRVQASSSLSANLTWKWPDTADNAGDCLVSSGAGQWNPGSCTAGLTPPITFSGNISGDILTVTQSGTGNALKVNGPASVNGALTVTSCTGCGGVTSVSASAPVTATGTSTPVIACPTCVTTAGGQTISGTTTFNTIVPSTANIATLNVSGLSTMHDITATTISAVVTAGPLGNAVSVTNNGSGGGLQVDSYGSADTLYVQNHSTGNAANFQGPVNVSGALTVASCTGCGSGVASVSGSSPISSSGGSTPAISCPTCITTAGGQTIANSSSTSTLTVTQSSTGHALDVNGAVSVAGGTGGFTVTSGGITSTSTGDGVLIAAGNSLGGQGILELKSFGSTQRWDVKSNTSNNFVVRDNTAGVDYFTIAHATGAISGTHIQNLGTTDSPTFSALTVSSCSGCGGGGGVTSVTASSPVASSGGATPNITCSSCITSLSAGAGISVSGSTITNTGVLNYSPGIKVLQFSGTSGSLATFSNGIYVYDNSGSYIGMIPLI